MDMSNMFQWAGSFDQDLSLWEPANVTDMSYMFNEAVSFRYILCWKQLPTLNDGMFDDSCGWVDSTSLCKPGRINPKSNCSHTVLPLLPSLPKVESRPNTTTNLGKSNKFSKCDLPWFTKCDTFKFEAQCEAADTPGCCHWCNGKCFHWYRPCL